MRITSPLLWRSSPQHDCWKFRARPWRKEMNAVKAEPHENCIAKEGFILGLIIAGIMYLIVNAGGRTMDGLLLPVVFIVTFCLWVFHLWFRNYCDQDEVACRSADFTSSYLLGFPIIAVILLVTAILKGPAASGETYNFWIQWWILFELATISFTAGCGLLEIGGRNISERTRSRSLRPTQRDRHPYRNRRGDRDEHNLQLVTDQWREQDSQR